MSVVGRLGEGAELKAALNARCGERGHSKDLGQKLMGSFGPLTIAASVVRSAGVVEADVNGEVVVLHIEKGSCYGLNRIGSRVWQLALSPVRIADICASLEQEYEVVPATCEEDVLALLEGLRTEGLIDQISPGDTLASTN